MSVQVVLEEYGQALQNNHQITGESAPFYLKLDDIPQCYEAFSFNENTEIGFFAIIPQLIFDNWKDISTELHSYIKTSTLHLFQGNLSSNIKFHLSQFIYELYLRYNIWPELMDLFVQTNSPINIDPILFSLIIPLIPTEFLMKNQEALFKNAMSLLQLSYSTEFCDSTISTINSDNSIRILRLLRTFQFIKFDYNDPSFLKLFWHSCFSILASDPDDIDIIWPIIMNIFNDVERAQMTEKYIDISKCSEEELSSIVRLLPLFSISDISLIYQRAKILTESNNSNSLYCAFKSAFYDEMTHDQLQSIIDIVKQDPQPSNLFCALPAIGSTDFDISSLLKDIIDSPVFLYGVSFSRDDFSFVQPVLNQILKSPSPAAFKALKHLMQNGSIKTRPQFKSISDAYIQIISMIEANSESIHIDDLKKFNRVIEQFITDDNFDSIFITPLNTLLRNIFKSERPEIFAIGLSLFSTVSIVDESCPPSFAHDLFSRINSIFGNKEEDFYPSASSALYALVTTGAPTYRSMMNSVMPQLIEYCKGNKEESDRISTSQSIAAMIASFEINSQVPSLINLILFYLRSQKSKLISASCAMTNMLRELIDNTLGQTLFPEIARSIVQVSSVSDFNILMKIFNLLAHNLNVNTIIGTQLCNLILDEQILIFKKQPLVDWFTQHDELFDVLALYVNQPMVTKLLKIFAECREEMFSQFIIPLNHYFRKNDGEEKVQFSKICASRAISCKCGEAIEVALSMNEKIDGLKEQWSQSQSENDGSIENSVEWKCYLVIGLIKQKDLNVDDVDDLALLKEILANYPYGTPNQVNWKIEEITQCLLDFAKSVRSEKGPSELELPVIQAFCNILLLQKKNLDEFELKAETLNGMKQYIKNVMKGNRMYEKEMQKYFGGVRSKMNKFNTLLK